MATDDDPSDHQLDLFPLHPDHHKDDDNVSLFFSSCHDEGCCGGPTLTGLLGAAAGESCSANDDDAEGRRRRASEEVALVRNAMRNRERDRSEEKWVFYTEVVERKDEEVTSCAADSRFGRIDDRTPTIRGRLSLKLDYEEIMNAWSDKGPLYVHSEAPQTVPKLHDESPIADDPTVSWGSGSRKSEGVGWRVPEMSEETTNSRRGWRRETTRRKTKKEEEDGEEDELEEENSMQQRYILREASVLRYKQKRQNRLFSNTIRYQVRKLNAQNRPRLKGRFVKRG